MSAVSAKASACPPTMPHDGWIKPLTSGLPQDIEWSLIPDPLEHDHDAAFWLYGVRNKKTIFARREVLDFQSRTTRTGSFSVKDGGKGIATRYVANFALFARDVLGFEALRMFAAETTGGLFWARFAELDPPSATATETSDLIQYLRKGLRLAEGDLARDNWSRVNAQIEVLKDLSAPDAVRALWPLAEDRTPLGRNGEKSTSERFQNAAQRYTGCDVPFNAFLLPGSKWHGIVRLHEHSVPLQRLMTLAHKS